MNHREVCKKIQSDIPSRNNIPCRRQFEPSICRLNFGKRWRVNRPYRNVAGELRIISIPVPVARSFTRAHSGVGYFSTLGSKGRGILFGHFFKSITSSWQASSLGKQRASTPSNSTKVRRAPPPPPHGNIASNSRFPDCLLGFDGFNRRICDSDDDRGSLRS